MRSTAWQWVGGDQLHGPPPPRGPFEHHEEGQEGDDDQAEDGGGDPLDGAERAGCLSEGAAGALSGGGAADLAYDVPFLRTQVEATILSARDVGDP
jgi:hypothetical protein